jgi:hypothetical protein
LIQVEANSPFFLVAEIIVNDQLAHVSDYKVVVRLYIATNRLVVVLCNNFSFEIVSHSPHEYVQAFLVCFVRYA